MKKVHFISKFEYYRLEKCGDKPYTLRDNTFRTSNKIKEATHITIHKGYTKECFTRKISNILWWKDNIMIAWRNQHNKKKVYEVKVENEKIKEKMNKQELIKKFKNIKDVRISKQYIAIFIKVKFFTVEPKPILEIFDYLYSKGYNYVGDLGIDCNKFIFEKR